MSPDQELQRRDSAEECAAPAVASHEDDLLSAWDRLLAIASLYPAGNTRFLLAAAQWRETMARVARADGSVCIEVGREERLSHEGRVHSPERVARSRLYPLFTGIGVEHVVLSGDLTVEALHQLLTILRETHRVADRALGFQHAELPELPAGVSIKLRSFGSPGENGLGSAPASGGGGAAPPEGEIAGMRNPHVGIQDELGESLEGRLTDQATALYQRFTEGIAPEPVAKTAPAEDRGEGRRDRRERESAPFDARQLQSRLEGLESAIPFDAELLGPCQPEWLALQLQLSLDEDGNTALCARRELAAALERELSLQEIQSLVGACESLLSGGDAGRVDALLPLLLEPMECQGQRFESILTTLAEGLDAGRREQLWPHLADALLREAVAPGLAAIKGADGETALALPEAAQARVLARLEARPALQAGRLAPSLFSPLRTELRPLLQLLLQSSRGNATGALLRAALRESSLPAPFAGLLALLGDFKPSHREFYRLLLGRENAMARAALDREAATLALQMLPRLARRQRQRPEALDLLLALTPAPPGEADALLAALLTERWLLVLPAWPAAARKQVRQVQQRRRRQLGLAQETQA